MASPSITDQILILRNQYPRERTYGQYDIDIHAGRSIINNSFIGALYVTNLTAMDSIVHEAPACIASQSVNMVAKNAIHLGTAGQGLRSVPARLFASQKLTITTSHLSIGELAILKEPKHALIFCSKLTFIKSSDEEPEYFETVRSWAINDAMETEVITRSKEPV